MNINNMFVSMLKHSNTCTFKAFKKAVLWNAISCNVDSQTKDLLYMLEWELSWIQIYEDWPENKTSEKFVEQLSKYCYDFTNICIFTLY